MKGNGDEGCGWKVNVGATMGIVNCVCLICSKLLTLLRVLDKYVINAQCSVRNFFSPTVEEF